MEKNNTTFGKKQHSSPAREHLDVFEARIDSRAHSTPSVTEEEPVIAVRHLDLM
jgi:hypothetical protein